MFSKIDNWYTLKIMNRRYRYLFSKYIFPRIHSKINDDKCFWNPAIKESGVEIQKLIRTRGYKRGVFLVKHPSYGRCILKTSCPIREPAQGLSDLSISKIIAESNPGIFPHIYESASSYTLEEFIDGTKFFKWMPSDYNPTVVKNYFSALKFWSIKSAGDFHDSTLKPDEIRYLCNKYIKKSIGQLHNLTKIKQLQSSYLISRQRGRMAQQIDWLWQAADEIKLHKSVMCDDMGTKNILVDSNTDQLYNIDYEFLRIGHYGFDAAYFLSNYLTHTRDEAGYNKLSKLILTSDYLGEEYNIEFFQTFADLLGEIGQIIFKHWKD